MHIIVIGGGHAGIEAANITARMGINTTLLTTDLDKIGQMDCNPSIGGVGKGHMVRELDAIGGVMGRLADQTTINFKILNTSRGMAVRGPRAQIDRIKYKIEARKYMESIPNLNIYQGILTSICYKQNKIIGIKILDGSFISCDAIIITIGTYLNSQFFIGNKKINDTRIGKISSIKISRQLRDIGIKTKRLKTGTSPRINFNSINFNKLEQQKTDQYKRHFSFFTDVKALQQIPCYIARTTQETASIVYDNMKKSSLYGGYISGIGPRYCPSIEDKFIKFKDKLNHQIFVEPDSLDTKEIYLSGFSTSMPVDIQLRMVNSIKGFEYAQIIKPGYAIEYDCLDPLQLKQDLSFNGIDGIWFAGQINGTTGYEEAAGQGIIAGINAARWLKNLDPIILTRDEAYIGVMIDDLVTKGIDEPYRMLTARAEHRLKLSCDLANIRLLHIAKQIGVLTPAEIKLSESTKLFRESIINECRTINISQNNIIKAIMIESGINNNKNITLLDLLSRHDIIEQKINQIFELLPTWPKKDNHPKNWDYQHEISLILYELRYKDFQNRESHLFTIQKIWDYINIPTDFKISDINGLSNEVKEKLHYHQPQTLGQASRIPGVTPAAITLLHMLLERYKNR